MPIYREKLRFFVYHSGMVRLNTLMRIERMGISRGDALMIMDYSEKLNRERSKQAQTEHWETTAMTIEVAVAEGSTQIRVGTALFGPRPPRVHEPGEQGR